MNTEKYAFWEYDQYPYVLGGKVVNTLPTGNVEVAEYGMGTTGFKPLAIFPCKLGKLMAQRLAELKQQRADELKRVNASFDRKILSASSELYRLLSEKGRLTDTPNLLR